MNPAGPEDDPDVQARLAAFQQTLRRLGWTEGHNLRLDVHWGGGDLERVRKNIAEVTALSPDVILAPGNSVIGPLLQATRSVPIVFLSVADPVGAGFVDSLARPGGNATGFLQFEYTFSGKWLELLKQISPSLTRVGVLRDPAMGAAVAQFAVIQAAASALGVEVHAINTRDSDETERAVAAFARQPNGGLILTTSALAFVRRQFFVTLAARHKLPSVYYGRHFVDIGGLVSYGPNWLDQYRSAAGYVDRILKGERPADLPVQAPTKYELVINLKTAKALGLNISPTLLARAEEVIE
jgi:putative ABC transport system substrate-binding protein